MYGIDAACCMLKDFVTESKDWKLCESLRKYGREGFTPYLLEVVRGKAEAHEVERKLIRQLKPRLNTDVR